MNKELEIVAYEAFNKSHKEIFHFEYEGKRYWLKKARRAGANVFHRLGHALTNISLLAPPLVQNKNEALKHESSKLKKLHSLGASVPKVELITKDFFILNDTGVAVLDAVRVLKEDEKKTCLEKTIKELALLHNHGEYHGGSQIKNFTYKDEEVFILDFEENFSKEIELNKLFTRDLFLLFFSLFKHGISADYEELLRVYKEAKKEPNEAVKEFLNYSKRFKKIRAFLKLNFFQKTMDKDTKSILKMLDAFLEIDEKWRKDGNFTSN